MPSPFPGMDPYIEGQLWRDFHISYYAAVAESLIRQIRPKYMARFEEEEYVEHCPEEAPVITGHPGPRDVQRTPPSNPVDIPLPLPELVKQRYLSVRERESRDVVCVIEVLSPDNKREGSDGRRLYLNRRAGILKSPVHLVEVDLLRGGARLPTRRLLPPADFYAFVARSDRRPIAQVYPWTIREPMPSIPIPLQDDDPDAVLNLQGVFTGMFDRSGFDYSLRRDRPVMPPLHENEAAWVQRLVAGNSPQDAPNHGP